MMSKGVPMATARTDDLRAFHEFVGEQLANGGASLTPAEALVLWEIQQPGGEKQVGHVPNGDALAVLSAIRKRREGKTQPKLGNMRETICEKPDQGKCMARIRIWMPAVGRQHLYRLGRGSRITRAGRVSDFRHGVAEPSGRKCPHGHRLSVADSYTDPASHASLSATGSFSSH